MLIQNKANLKVKIEEDLLDHRVHWLWRVLFKRTMKDKIIWSKW